jgi:hypothetical protein
LVGLFLSNSLSRFFALFFPLTRNSFMPVMSAHCADSTLFGELAEYLQFMCFISDNEQSCVPNYWLYQYKIIDWKSQVGPSRSY